MRREVEQDGQHRPPAGGVGPADPESGQVRNEEKVRGFVEEMAMILADWGFPRMAARVLMVLMAADEEGLTAGAISGRLSVSPAAVSGAVRYLQQLGMVVRTAVPGSRSDVYAVPENSWYVSAIVRGGLYKRLADLSDQGAQAAGGPGTANRRLGEMRDFFLFLDEESGKMRERWIENRAQAAEGSEEG